MGCPVSTPLSPGETLTGGPLEVVRVEDPVDRTDWPHWSTMEEDDGEMQFIYDWVREKRGRWSDEGSKLALTGNRLQELPEEIGGLLDVKKLLLGANKFQRLPPGIGRLEGLEGLWLGGNELTSLPREIGQLRTLRCLDVRRNKLRDLPSELGQLENLEVLQLQENELRSLPSQLNRLRKLQGFRVENNGLAGEFVLRELFDRMAGNLRCSIHLSGNSFAPSGSEERRFVEATLHEPLTEGSRSSICAVSFCGAEFLDWQLLLVRAKLQERPFWSQLAVFFPGYAKTVGRNAVAPNDWHSDGLGSGACRRFGSYFASADSFTEGKATAAHRRFGCSWFQRWTEGVEKALAMGHRRFVIFTKVDGTVGVCQTVEWLFLLKARENFPDLELLCASVADANEVLQFGPSLDSAFSLPFTEAPVGLPVALDMSLSLTLP